MRVPKAPLITEYLQRIS